MFSEQLFRPPQTRLCLGTHLPSGLDPLPDAEEADDPHGKETQGQVPLQGPDVLDPGGDAQHVASAASKEMRLLM